MYMPNNSKKGKNLKGPEKPSTDKAMSSNSNTLPPKGILKGKQTRTTENEKGQCSLPATGGVHDAGRAHFDEMNIIQTYHPADKDYGHMKIEEPNTPYHVYMEPEEETPEGRQKVKRASVDYNKSSVLDPEVLAKQLLERQTSPLKATVANAESDDEAVKNKAFSTKRAAHYGKEFVKRSELPPDED